MHYVSQSRPNPAGWLRRALREILFVFLPAAVIVMYFIIKPEAEPVVLAALVVYAAIPALILWALYRVIRFALGK